MSISYGVGGVFSNLVEGDPGHRLSLVFPLDDRTEFSYLMVGMVYSLILVRVTLVRGLTGVLSDDRKECSYLMAGVVY